MSDGFAPEPEPRGIEPIRLVTGEEYASDPSPDALVDGLIYEASSHIVTGASKAGKTWWALQLVLCVAHGQAFLGLDVREAPVLLLSLELSAGMLRQRLQAIAQDLRLPELEIGNRFHLVAPTLREVPQVALTSDTAEDAIGELIERTGARLVIFDTLYRFIPGIDPNSNGEVGEIFGRINGLSQRTGAALVLIDHVAKGEQLGPVSHSALGASVKGGASRVVIALKRTSKQDGGRWELDVESHFGSWEEPLHYERPLLEGGERGHGCVPCGATEAYGIGLDALEDLFTKFGVVNGDGRPTFSSKNKLRTALMSAGHATGGGDSDAIVRGIVREHCVAKGSAYRTDRPIVIEDGPRNSTRFHWRGRCDG